MTSAGFHVAATPVQGFADTSALRVSGQIDAKNLMQLKTQVEQLATQGVKRYILDFEEVKYVNSSGLSYLINLSESLGEGRKAVILLRLQPKVKIIFDTMGVTTFFAIAPSMEAALKALASAPVEKKPTIRRGESSTKTGRVSPPTSAGDKNREGSWIVRLFRRLFGRSTAP